MSQHTFTRPEVLVANERHLKYQGVAKVDINQINFTQHETSLDTQKAERLRKIFLKEGCYRLDVRNHIPCTISSQHLNTSLERAGVTRSGFMGGTQAAKAKISRHDIETLQLMAPSTPDDSRTVKGLVLSGKERLRGFDGLIPSLFIFFEDCKYLEECAHCMQRLIKPSERGPTIRQVMKSIFNDSNYTASDFRIQTSKDKYRTLYAMHHFYQVDKASKKKDRLAGRTMAKANKKVLYNIAILAQIFGFKSPKIEKLVAENPDRIMARQFESLIDTVIQCYRAAKKAKNITSCDLIEPDAIKRCGVPLANIHNLDILYLFLDNIHADNLPDSRLSSFFVRRSVYFLFFDRLSLPESSASDRVDIVSPFPTDIDMASSQWEQPRREEQHQKHGRQLNKEQELQQREDRLQNREQELQQREDQLQNREQELQHREDQLQNREQELQHREDQLQNREQELQHREDQLQNREQELQHREDQLQNREQELQHREDQLQNREREAQQELYQSQHGQQQVEHDPVQQVEQEMDLFEEPEEEHQTHLPIFTFNRPSNQTQFKKTKKPGIQSVREESERERSRRGLREHWRKQHREDELQEEEQLNYLDMAEREDRSYRLRKQGQLNIQTTDSSIKVILKILDNEEWKTEREIIASKDNTFELESLVKKYSQKKLAKLFPHDRDMRSIRVCECFQVALLDDKHEIFLRPPMEPEY
ncbi:hypothetical protein TEQG_03078 [Trichophyton equinum CBS 127.97]|uniref:Uncharacterized protein n=1 Tax=Trichophyton equinum (strain ATCC MYA-4606 / CBS 127.97) TaxID=559882 RepID=F2PQ76_TRIEC|nr:hypothetical protein TEQG_03078 [Trichophyton equinum CBS 127.97]